MDGQEITQHNNSMPWFPDSMNFFERIWCLLGYHKRETRQTFEYAGKTHDQAMQLRDQCGRCHTLLSHLWVKNDTG